MKKLCMAALMLPGVALAQLGTPQSPTPMLLLQPGAHEAADVQMVMAAGFVQCDPSAALPRAALEPRGVEYAAGAGRALPPAGVTTSVVMLLKPQAGAQTERAADGGGYLSAGAEYALARPPMLPGSRVRITAVGQAAYFVPRPSTVSISLRFDRPTAEAVRALDARTGGAISHRLGESHASEHLWYVAQADGHTLTCYRQPDAQVAP